MTADISRDTFDPARQFSRVRIQQGRVQVDADWNEQVDILVDGLRSLGRDLAGGSGAPASDPGFRLEVQDALDFDGKRDFVFVKPSSSLEFPLRRPLTIEARVRPRMHGGGGTVVASYQGGVFSQFYLRIDPDGRIGFHLGDHRAEGSLPGTLYGSTPVPFGETSTIAVTWDGHRARMYLDGALVGAADAGDAGDEPVAPLAPIEGRPLWMGCLPVGERYEWFYDGAIEWLRLWGVARTPREIERHVARPVDPATPGLVGDWRLDEGEGGRAADSSPYGNTGFLGDGFDDEMPEWTLSELTVDAGHLYASGTLVNNPKPVPYSRQPFLPGAQVPERSGAWLGWLHVWERSVLPQQDHLLLDPALDGVSTTTRVQTVWQARLLRLPDQDDPRKHWRAAFRAAESLYHPGGRLAAWRDPTVPRYGNVLYRVEIGCRGGRYGWPRPPEEERASVPVRVDAEERSRVFMDSDEDLARAWPPGQLVEIYDPTARRAGLLTWITSLDPRSGAVLLKEAAPQHLGLEPRMRPIGGYKWARDNATVVFGVEQTSEDGGDTVVTLDVPIGHEGLELAIGDLVEYLDDDTILRQHPQRPLRVLSILDPTHVTVDGPLPDVSRRERPLLRRWDNPQAALCPECGLVPLTVADGEDGAVIEHGISVRFEGGEGYAAYDHWLIVAREATPSLEWPTRPDGKPRAVPPRTPFLAAVPLAVLRRHGKGMHLVEDLVRIFGGSGSGSLPLTGGTLTGPLTVEAPLTVDGQVHVRGKLAASVLAGELEPGAVATSNLANGCVTQDKLAPDVGTVPPGALLLGSSAEPPRGYEYTGVRAAVAVDDARWRRAPALPGEVVALVALDGQLWGFTTPGTLWRRVGDAWRQDGPALAEPLEEFAAVAHEGRIHVLGGRGPAGEVRTHVAWRPGDAAWQELERLPEARCGGAAVSVDGRLHYLGGFGEVAWAWKWLSARHWAWESGRWSPRQPMPEATAGFASDVVAGRILVAGGEVHPGAFSVERRPTAKVFAYAPRTDQWEPRMPLASPCRQPRACSFAGDLLIVGGEENGAASARVERYRWADDAWSREADLQVARRAAGVALVATTAVVAGGAGADSPTETRSSDVRLFVHRKLDRDRGGLRLESP